MKRKIIGVVLASVGLVACTYGQGTLNFNNSGLPQGSAARIADWTNAVNNGTNVFIGFGAGQGTNFFVQLYAASSSTASLVAVGIPVNARSGSSASGYNQTSGTTTLGQPVDATVTITTPATSVGGSVWIQVRAWWGGGTVITNYNDAVISADARSRWGASEVFLVSGLGGVVPGQPSATPADLVNMVGFQLNGAGGPIVPEPTTLALAGIGAAALLLFRRRK